VAPFSQDFIASRTLSRPRAAAVGRFLADLEAWINPRSLADLSDADLRVFLEAKLAEGFHPNTVRKWLVMARTLATWLYERGTLSADTLLAIRAVRPPAGSSAGVSPVPYSRRELGDLRAILDRRWPRLATEDAHRLTARWREGRTPYKRIRRHAIRLQLDGVTALALELGLRRREIFALTVNWLHYDNDYIAVWGSDGPWSARVRKVPFTDAARQAVYDWIEFRSLLGITHDRPWVALHAEPRMGQAMKRETFDKLLRTFVGDGWTLKRLRDTCAQTWVRRGLAPEHLRQLLGHATIEDTLPYSRLVGGDLTRRMRRISQAAQAGEPRSMMTA
jgi:site-specific recombinase XerD